MESETIGLLMENDVEYSDFPDEVLTNLPELPWTIPADEVAKRRDFRYLHQNDSSSSVPTLTFL